MQQTAMSGAWDGDPWEIDSDDDEFVAQASGSTSSLSPSRKGARTRAGAGTSTATVGLGNHAKAFTSDANSSGINAKSTSSTMTGGSGFSFWGSSRSSSPASISKGKQPAQAPPARPHPISIGSYKEKRNAAESGSDVTPSTAKVGVNGSGTNNVLGTPVPHTGGRPAGRSSWLIVDPDNLTPTSSSFRSTSITLSEPSSSPGKSSTSAQSRIQNKADSTAGQEGGGSSKDGAPAGIESTALKASIRDDLDTLLDDPTSALARLSLGTPGDETIPGSPLSPESSTFVARSFPATPTKSASTDSYTSLTLSSSQTPDRPNDEGANDSSSNLEVPGQSSSTNGAYGSPLERKYSQRSTRRRQQFAQCLSAPTVDLAQLKSLAWKGVPAELRPSVWQLLLGYLPAAREARKAALKRKRAEYDAGVKLAFGKGEEGLDQAIWHQISIDVPRTNPGRPLWQRETTQRSLERILYVWAIRHPACGYVQGINDLATPFFEVFLSAYIQPKMAPELFDPGLLPSDVQAALEADTFWCLSKMLDGIQDNYIFAQPGIQRQVRRLGELVARIDAPLHAHLNTEGVEYMQFAFRWMNCLLMREMAVQSIVRLWDTYLAEGPDAFSDFHLYVCAVFLHKWSTQLQTMDFQGIIMHLQSLPTQGWSDKDAEMLLSEAFMYKTLFGNTAHLNK